MSFRGGRDRQWKDYPLRPEEKSHHGRSTAPPSRHLWVGNLSHTLTERALSNHFREFGELESVAFSPGRSYAFVNFIEVSAAFAAFGALQGFVLAGNALRIEFTKAEKSSSSSTPSHDEDHDLYLHRRDEPRSSLRESPFPPQRDSRIRHSNSNSNPDNQKSKDDDEPNEVLWIGFPQSLKVDEHSFWNAFSPFGEIEKISSYPGRTYAFVRFKHVNSAIRAKDNLQGKLFGNPRVHITFARSETNSRPSNTGKNSNPDPVSPRYGRQHDRYHDERKRRFSPEGNRLTGRNHGFRDTGHDGYGRRSSSRDRNVNFHDFPPPRQPPMYDDEWDLPEDALIFHGAKKLKGGLIPPEPELPEYPFSDSGDLRNALHRPPGFDNNNNLGHFSYHNKQMIHDPSVNVSQPYHLERGNTHNIQNTRNTLGGPYDAFQGGPVSLAQNAIEWKRPTPEPHIPANEEWKWEGIIAKGGTSICRARCFPVGKVLDMILPEFLDCTARTSLDMLSKHYYQAASSWVVFFVPESDADMAFYNEFMNYLGEKQRAAVAKLDDKTTLFLVPPSDFSEKILKVPGKLSISGVILRLEQPSTTIDTLPPPPLPLPPAQRQHDPYLMMSHGESGRAPSGTFQPFQNVGKPRPGGSTMPFHVENTNTPEHLLHHQSGGGGGGRLPPRSGGGGGGDFMVPNNQESGYRPGSPTVMPQYQEPKAVVTGGGIQPDQLAQLASFLGNSRQQQSVGEEFRQQNGGLVDNGYRTTTTTMTPHQLVSPSQHYHQAPPQPPSQQMSQYHQFQQMGQSGSGSQGNGQEETEADPQKRLQATLELAATLLKQIQQGKT